MSETYASAGVNIDLASRVKRMIGDHARKTQGPEVLSGVGFFGGLYEFKGYKEPVLVSSVDGVGTKLKIAIALNKHDTVGIDIVNHCVNDIFCCGAEPLFFLDYIAMGKMSMETVEGIVRGLSAACRDAGCALIGGETAEMPGMYAADDYDLAGFIVGVVEKPRMLMGQNIVPGDILIGLPSIGLHTNGYSLARKIFGVEPGVLNTFYPELGRTLGEALLEPHRCYYNQLKPLLPVIKGIAHITGGSFYKNIPRVLPEGLAARLNLGSWDIPPIFPLIQRKGDVDREEMFHVFNMGIGIVVFCWAGDVSRVSAALPGSRIIGEVVKQTGDPRIVMA